MAISFRKYSDDTSVFIPTIKETSITFDLKVEQPKVEGIYVPFEFNLPFNEVPHIFVGGCGGDINHKTDFMGTYNNFPSYMEAHTHMCPHDPLYRSICINKKKYILFKDGSPSDIMWHEYGHVLTPWEFEIECNYLDGSHTFTPDDNYEEDPTGHGTRWKNTMVKLGKPHINKSRMNMPQEEFDKLFD